MEKKVYMPTIEELDKMQNLGINLYAYLYVKALESLIISGFKFSINPEKTNPINNPNYKKIINNAYTVCAMQRIFPELNFFTSSTMADLDFDTFGLNLEKNTIQPDRDLVSDTLNKLWQNPKYRFSYPEDGRLDDIFYGKVKLSPNVTDIILMQKLVTIDPAYIVTNDEFQKYFSCLKFSIDDYFIRYGIQPWLGYEYLKKDILRKKGSEVRRLLRCIEENKLQ